MSAKPLAAEPEDDEPPLDWREHPPPEVLERFVRAELSRAENSAVVRHLLTRCPQCCYITRELFKIMAQKPQSRAELLKSEMRRLWQRTPSRPTRRKTAMAALVKAAQEMLLEMTVELQGFSRRLENMVEALPSSPQGDAELDDVVLELRNVISNVNHECVRRAIVDLRDAAYYPAEPADSAEPAP